MIPAPDIDALVADLRNEDTSMDFPEWCRQSRELRDEAATAISALRARVAELEARATPQAERCEHCGSKGFWCDWDFSAGESPCHRALRDEIARLRPNYASNTGTDQARRQMLDHFESFTATLSNQGSSSNG